MFRRINRFVGILLLVASMLALLPAPTSAQESPVKVIPVPGMLFSGQLSPDGTLLAMAENSNVHIGPVITLLTPVRLLNLKTGDQTALMGYADYAQSIAFSPDGKRLAAFYSVGYIYLWDIASGTLLKQISTSIQNGRIAFLADGKTLLMVTGNRQPELWLWDTDTGYVTAIFVDHPASFQAMLDQQYLDGPAQFALSSDEKTVAVVSMAGNISLWNLADGKSTLLVKSPDAIPTLYIRSLAFTPDGAHLVYYHSKDGKFHVVDAATGSETAAFDAKLTGVFALSPDGKTMAWVDKNAGALMMTSLDQPGTPQSIPLPTSDNYALQLLPTISILKFTPDGRQIVFSGFLSKSDTQLVNAVYVITLPQ